jgi:hypothetical protein
MSYYVILFSQTETRDDDSSINQRGLQNKDIWTRKERVHGYLKMIKMVE